jgi:thioredoxin-related protein
MKNGIILILVAVFTMGTLSAQTIPEPADKVLSDACKQAAAEKKNVMIIFHASWCGWCKKLEASINDPACKEYFDKNFVIRYLTVLEAKDKKNLENPGANDLFEQNGGKGGGIPYFLIYDKKGKLLADSKMDVKKPTGVVRSNMGCPAQDEEIAAFIETLKKTSKINEAQITAITKRFALNRN